MLSLSLPNPYNLQQLTCQRNTSKHIRLCT